VAKTNNSFGDRLREQRLKYGLTLQQVASDLNTSVSNLSNWELNKTQPDINWLEKISDYYKVTIDSLIRSEIPLVIGSCFPLVDEYGFHPIRCRQGFYISFFSLIFNRLFWADIFEKRFHLELIESWSVNRDRSKYTFYLREGVYFHDGKQLELDDVKYSYERFIEGNEFYKRFIDDIKIKHREKAVELRLKRWLEIQHLPDSFIIPRIYADDKDCFIGSGPFKLTEEYLENRRKGNNLPIFLERNVNYFSEKPRIK